MMTEIPKAAIEAAQDAYINGHISGDHFDALEAALQAAAPFMRAELPSVNWKDGKPYSYCPECGADSRAGTFADGIEAAAKVADIHGCNTDNPMCKSLASIIRTLTPQAKP